MIFSKRIQLAKEFEEWADENNVMKDVLGVITYLQIRGLLKEDSLIKDVCLKCRYYTNKDSDNAYKCCVKGTCPAFERDSKNG